MVQALRRRSFKGALQGPSQWRCEHAPQEPYGSMRLASDVFLAGRSQF